MEALSRSDKSIHLVVAGEFWEDAALYEQQISRLGLANRVTLLNKYIPDEEAHVIFSAVDALIAPYVGGTQSGVVELANGYGLPVMMTDIIAEGAQDKLSSVRVVPAGDPDALASAMNELATMPALGDISTGSARDDWKRMVKVIEGV